MALGLRKYFLICKALFLQIQKVENQLKMYLAVEKMLPTCYILSLLNKRFESMYLNFR